MAEKKKDSGFTVTDRRLFTEEGELRRDVTEDRDAERKSSAQTSAAASASEVPPAATGPDSHAVHASSGAEKANRSPSTFPGAGEQDAPPPPTAAEQQEQADAYRASSKELDNQVEMSGRSAKEFEMTFERFLASLYMTAMLQLGLMHQQGEQPRVDIIGARQTIDTLALLAEKTKGNLTSAEQNFLQNSLYEVRMAYVEVTNALSRPPQPGAATGTRGR